MALSRDASLEDEAALTLIPQYPEVARVLGESFFVLIQFIDRAVSPVPDTETHGLLRLLSLAKSPMAKASSS